MPRRLGLFDLMPAIIVVAASLFYVLSAPETQPETVRCFYKNKRIAEFPIDKDRVFSVKGDKGTIRISIKGGEASVVSAVCPRQICKNTAPISKPGEQIICVPNRVVVSIHGRNKREDVDGISR